VMWRRDEDQDTGEGRCADLHGVILTSNRRTRMKSTLTRTS
jgi:hypothetical protein